jgi:ubiquinol-cytochrome c reductase cytochrome b subunit
MPQYLEETPATESVAEHARVAEAGAESDNHEHHERGIPFIPHHALREAFTAIVALALLLLVTGMIPAPLDARANPFQSPAGVKPEWFFLAPFELLHLLPPLAGLGLTGAAVTVLLVWPFLDRRPKRITTRPAMIVLSAAILLTVVVLSVMPYVRKG